MRWLMLCGCLFCLAGCGGGGGQDLPVSGIVTLDGNPIADVTVRFYPDGDTDKSSNGYGQTGTDGKFVITNGKGKQGLVAGRYKVTVSKGKASTTATSEEGAGAVIPGIEFKDEFPARYSDLASTTLSYSVTGDGQPIEIKLDSKKK